MAVMSSGQRFMTDLLVTSLMADGGLETALNMAIKSEVKSMDQSKVKSYFKPLRSQAINILPHQTSSSLDISKHNLDFLKLQD